MITTSYQSCGNGGLKLRLRLYQEGETRYVSVTKLLKGNVLRRHWNQQKQRLIPSCPFSEENNEILALFKQRYDKAAIGWEGTLYGFIASMEMESKKRQEADTLYEYIRVIIERLGKRKHADGSVKGSFEGYLKCEKRLIEFCQFNDIDYYKILITELTSQFVENIFNWIEKERGGKGMRYVSKILHSILMKADKDGLIDFNNFKGCNWFKDSQASVQKYYTLTREQCRQFATMDLDEIHNSGKNEIYRDFCLFLLYTGQSPCDALTLRYSDIQTIGGVSHFVFKRRKIAEKQSVPCTVPISQDMQRIMDKWRKHSKDGYIFPVRSKKKLQEQVTNNGDIKHFIGYLDYWLKPVGKALGCRFPLHTYTFRHTAITHYVSQGVPMAYVANMMGTSVKNIEKIYYNNHGDIASRNKVLMAMAI